MKLCTAGHLVCLTVLVGLAVSLPTPQQEKQTRADIE